MSELERPSASAVPTGRLEHVGGYIGNELGLADQPVGSRPAELVCHTCRTLLATGRTVGKVLDAPNPVDPEEQRSVTIGAKIRLEAGFVNAKREHDTGRPWYRKRSGSALELRVRVRPPCVLTCDCGQDNLVEIESPLYRDFAEGDASRRQRAQRI